MGKVRCYGTLTDSKGNPMTGKLYFYKVLDDFFGWHSLVKKDGKLIEPVDGKVVRWYGAGAEAVPKGHPAGHGYFEVPGGAEQGFYYVDVHPYVGGSKREFAGPVNVNGSKLTVKLSVDVSAPSIVFTKKMFDPGFFSKAMSYYGAVGGKLDFWKKDFDKFAEFGFNGPHRIWTEWVGTQNIPSPGCRVFNPDGSVIRQNMDKLHQIVDLGAKYGMIFDLTMAAGNYDHERNDYAKPGTLDAQLRAVKTLATEFKGNTAISFIDLGNESSIRKKGTNGSNHLSGYEYIKLCRAISAIDGTRKLTYSQCGPWEPNPEQDAYGYSYYSNLMNDMRGMPGGRLDLLTPHYERDGGWGKKEGQRNNQLKEKMREECYSGTVIPPIYNQEPARNDYPHIGFKWEVHEFVDSFVSSKQTGSLGCCLHNDACFDMRNACAWDQLDNIEKEAMKQIKSI